MSTTEVVQQPADAAEDVAAPTGISTKPRLLGASVESWRRLLHRLAPALLYLGTREIGLLVLGWMAGRNGMSVTTALTSWDGQWYLGIAKGGYGNVPPGLFDAFGRRSTNTALAFFPGYPELVRLVHVLPGIDYVAAAFTVSLVCGVLAAYALARLGRHVGGDRVGWVLVVLFAAAPMGIVLSMAYSEALFCALAAWSLVGVMERNWLLAGLAAAGAGLVRPTAAAIVVAVMAAAIVAIVKRRDGWRPWLGLLLAPAGLLGYLAYTAARTGELSGWFAVQRQGWNSMFDGGAATLHFGLEVLANGRSVLEVGTVAFLLVAIVLVGVGFRQRLPWPLMVYGALVLAMDLGSNGLMNSKARLLLPAFTLLLPAAIALARRRPATMTGVLVGVVLAGAWFGGYAITGWQFAI